MNSDVSILIIGFDGYSDLWNDCVSLLKRFWSDCPYDIVFVNNEIDFAFDGVKTIHAGTNAEWSKKVQVGLQSINSKYVCLLLEDFFVSDTVNTIEFEKLISLMNIKCIDYLKLADLNNAFKDLNKAIPENKKIHMIKYSDDYGICLQASIWNHKYLNDLVGDANYNAWIFEFNRVKESQQENKKGYRTNALFDTSNPLHLKHGVMQSKYIPSTIKFFKSKGIVLNVKREVMSRSKYSMVRFISFCKGLIPLWLRRPIKRIMEKFGVKFVSTVRDK